MNSIENHLSGGLQIEIPTQMMSKGSGTHEKVNPIDISSNGAPLFVLCVFGLATFQKT